MNRATCPHCGKQFKKEEGLAYHLGWAHKSTDAGELHRTDAEGDDDDILEGLFGPDYDDDIIKALEEPYEDKDFLEEPFEQPFNEAQLLRQVQQELGRLADVVDGAVNKHIHGGDGNCTKCHELLHDIRQRGIEQGAHAVLNIPGVREAITLNEWANERNGDNPSSPVVISWFDVPGVKEAISKYLYDEGEVVLRNDREVLEEEERFRKAATPGSNGWAVQPVKGNSLRRLFPATRRAAGKPGSVAVGRFNTNGNGQEDGLIHIIP